MPDVRAALRQMRHDAVIALLALVSVGIGAYELLRPRVDTRFTLLDAVDLAIVFVFIVDFIARARGSGDVRAYTKRHWWELPSLIPVTGGLVEGAAGVSVLRGVRLLRLARLVRLARVVGVAARAGRLRRYLVRVARRARLPVFALFAVGAVGLGALALLAIEGEENPAVHDFEDALWWSANVFTNLAAAGFGVVTSGGRVLTIALGFAGLGFIGVFTASMASAILVEPSADEEESAEPLDETPLD